MAVVLVSPAQAARAAQAAQAVASLAAVLLVAVARLGRKPRVPARSLLPRALVDAVVVPAVAVAAVVVVAAVNPPSAFRASVLLMPSEKLGWHLFWCPLDRQMELANDLPVYYYRASMKFPSLKTLLFIGLYAAVGAAGYWLGNSRAASSAPTPAKSRAPAGAAANTHGRLPGTVTTNPRGFLRAFVTDTP